MKKIISFLSFLAMLLSLTVSVYATDVNTSSISDKQYQRYLEIAKQVSEETGIQVTVGEKSNFDASYTDEKFENEVREFCNEVGDFQNAFLGTPYAWGSNPSSGGTGIKYLNVNSSNNIDNKYFLWTITGMADVRWKNNTYVLNTVKIDRVTPQRMPDGYVLTLGNNGSASGTTKSKTIKRSAQIKKNNRFLTSLTFSATFVLNTSSGSVTMRGSSTT